jgi:hypothetical protein
MFAAPGDAVGVVSGERPSPPLFLLFFFFSKPKSLLFSFSFALSPVVEFWLEAWLEVKPSAFIDGGSESPDSGRIEPAVVLIISLCQIRWT